METCFTSVLFCCPSPEDDEDGTGEGGWEDDAASSSSSESELNNWEGVGEEDAASSSSSESELNNQEGGGEEDAASTSSSESELNNGISQEFLQRVKGHYCSMCREQHYLTSTDLATFKTEAQCEHVYCYLCLSSRKSASGNGNLTCPECKCTALNIIHHQPIRLDDGLPYLRNTPQETLGRSEGHECGICFEIFKLSDADLGTMDTTELCRHICCYNCLLQHKRQRKRITELSNAQVAGQFLLTSYVTKGSPVMKLKF